MLIRLDIRKTLSKEFRVLQNRLNYILYNDIEKAKVSLK